MKKVFALLIMIVVLLCCSCYSNDAEKDNAINQTDESSRDLVVDASNEKQKKIEELSQKYEAMYFADIFADEDVKYSADVIDLYRGKSVYLDTGEIVDVVYENQNRYLLVNEEYISSYSLLDDFDKGSFGDNFYVDLGECIFKIEIDDQQYQELKDFSRNTYGTLSGNAFLFLAFSLDDIQVSFDIIDMEVENPDGDYDTYTNRDKMISVYGTLVHICPEISSSDLLE